MQLPVEQVTPQRRGPFSLALSILTGLMVVVAVTLGVLWLIPRNEYLLLPGQALNVENMISINGHPLSHKVGRLYMTDVSLYKVNHLIEELYGRLRSDADLQPAPQVSGGLSETQFTQLNVQLMSTSIQDAEAAALSQVRGYHPHFAKTGPRIIFVIPGTPAASVLKPGDVLVSVDGYRVRRALQVSPHVRGLRPGQVVRLDVLRAGKRLQLSVRTIPSTNGQPNKHGRSALIGIELQDQIVLPVKIGINAGDIGGPSAGLMFALGIIQRLEPADIAHGCRIAGTGTITADGVVGPIGGAKQKIAAARGVGAKYFFVPDDPSNVGPAMAHRGNVIVVPVKTLQQALAYLRQVKPCK